MKRTFVIGLCILLLGCGSGQKVVEEHIEGNDVPEQQETIDVENIPWETISMGESLDFIESKGTGLLMYSFVDCPWCKVAVKVLEPVSDQFPDIKTYYVDVKRPERETGQHAYDQLYEMFSPYLKEELGEDNEKMYLPYFVFLKDGEIMLTHTGTIDSSLDLTDEQTVRFKALLIEGYEKIE